MRHGLRQWVVAIFLAGLLGLHQSGAMGSLNIESSQANPAEAVPGRLIVKLKSIEDPGQAERAREDFDRLNARFGAISVRPILKDFIPVWERRRKEAGFTTNHREGWYWYLEEKDWMPKSKESAGGTSNRQTAEAKQEASVKALEHLHLQQMVLVEFSNGADVSAAAQAYAGSPAVEYAHPDYIMQANLVPNDPYYGSSGAWGQSFPDLWGLQKLNAAAAWDQTQGSGVVVAVTDTGVDYNHEDLSANIWTNPGEIPGNGVDDDGNGFIDDWHGYDFVTIDGTPPDNNPMDDHGHGTHVSGTIAAVGNNGIGMIGVAPKAKIMPVKGLDSRGSGALSDLINTIVYAADNGAGVINASWGGSGSTPQALTDAIAYAHDVRDVVFVAAAGNSSADVGNPDVGFLPADQRGVVTVSAFDSTDTVAYFSNFGPKIDVGAPGGGDTQPTTAYQPYRSILSLRAALANPSMTGSGQLLIGNRYLRQAGTSMASPHVAGVAALVRALHPSYSAEQVRQAIRRGSDDLGSAGFDLQSGYGRVNAYGALQQNDPLAVHLQVGGTVTGSAIPIVGTVAGPNLSSWRLEYGSGDLPSTWTPIASGTTPVANALLTNWDVANVWDGSQMLRLVAQNSSGAIFEDRSRVKIDQVVLTDPSPSTLMTIAAGKTITIRGTAAPANFVSYTLKVFTWDGTELSPSGMTVINGGLTRVRDGVLGTWDTSSIPANRYEVRLLVTVLAGKGAKKSVVSESAQTLVDLSLHDGWPVYLGRTSLYLMHHLNATDVNGDGKADLVVGYGDTVRILDHTGAMLPGWPQTVDPNQTGVVIQAGVAVGDIDGDGLPEVVAGTPGTGSLTTPGQIFAWHADGRLVEGWPKKPSPGGAIYGVALEDIDGDGFRDIVTTDFGGHVNVLNFRGTSLPGWPVTLDPTLSYRYLAPPVIGDLDGDGKKEIVVADTSSPTNLTVLRSDGTVLPGWPKTIDPGAANSSGYIPIYPALGDLDGDGHPEVVIGSKVDGRVHAFRFDGTELTGWPQSTISLRVNGVVIGDIDGDGKPEVVATTGPAYGTQSKGQKTTIPVDPIYAWHGNGSPLAGWPIQYPQPSYIGGDISFQTPSLADVNGDGKADIVVSSRDFVPFLLHAYQYDGKEVGGFPKVTLGNGGLSLGDEPELANSPAIADIDGDGSLEVAWLSLTLYLYVWDVPAKKSAPQPWPMFEHDAQKTGRSGN